MIELIKKFTDKYNNKLITGDIIQNLKEQGILKKKQENSIKDIENLKRELKRDGLYSDKLEEFLENYMKYYNK